MVNKIVNKVVLFLMLSVMVLFSGCSSNEPVISEVKIVDLKYNQDKQRIDYFLEVKYASNEEMKSPTSGIMKVTFDDDPFTKELDWGFMIGEQNNKLKFSLGESDYIIGTKATGKVEMIKGTKVIDSKPFEVVYNG